MTRAINKNLLPNVPGVAVVVRGEISQLIETNLTSFVVIQRIMAVTPGRLMEMCRWMGSHFHYWTDYNWVALSTKVLVWGRIFSGFGGKNILISREFVSLKNIGRFAVQK